MNTQLMNMAELRTYARSLGLPMIQHENRDKLEQRIARLTVGEPVESFAPPVKLPIPVAVVADKNELMTALQPFVEKGVEIKLDNDSWIARYRGAEDSGSLTIPVHVIVRLIRDGVARGAILPRKHKGGDLDGALSA